MSYEAEIYDGLEDLAFEALNEKNTRFELAWQCKDGTVIAIKDMSTKHIHNCIAMIKRSIRLHRDGLIDHIWRLEYLEPLQEEINNRKFAEDMRNMSDDEFPKNNSKWKKMKKYKVYDTTGAWLRTFDSWKAAYSFCLTMGRRDWQIK